MSLVIGLFKSADDGSGGSDNFGKLPLRQAGGGSEFDDLSGGCVQWVFIKEMRVVNGNLIVLTERNRRYSVDLKTRTIRNLK